MKFDGGHTETEVVHRPAILALEDGRVFNGRAAGAITRRGGEVVFQYQSHRFTRKFSPIPAMQDRSFGLTYPHIGNVGANLDDEESARPYIESLMYRAGVSQIVCVRRIGGRRKRRSCT